MRMGVTMLRYDNTLFPVLFSVAAGYAVISNSSDRLGIKRVAKKARKGGDKAAAFDEDEWVKGTPYDVEKRKKAAAKAGKQS
jgi:hypothetical protein